MVTSLLCAVALVPIQAKDPADAKIVDLGDGYVRVEAKTYSIEVPQGWSVSPETRWGQRKISPEGKGELGAMTAPPSQQSWDQLYQTALYFILRDGDGKPTKYEIVKTKRGYQAAAFNILDESGFAKQRYMMIKHETKGLLALSVAIPDKKSEEVWAGHFKRMVDTAQFK
ncbi:hypothetical protein QPK87_10590 [Kamptonema cortianum]|nr:hypothetical protein [Geitlerinema splendidum]MDK3157021.1 hypothetical protein [Kamptonema cortianum]